MKRRNWRGAKGTQGGGCVTNKREELEPTPVPGAKPVGDVRARWAWTEPSVWTERMLTALEQGVKGGKWYSLMDKVCKLPHLQSAFQRVKENRGSAGVDHQTVAMFEEHLEANLTRLSQTLADGTYRPQGIRRTWIPKFGSHEKRPLGIPTVRDRVVQTALNNLLEPIFEQRFADTSFGFRKGRGCKDALRRVAGLLKKGYIWVVDADLRRYFETIPHESLMVLVEQDVADSKVLALIQAFLTQKVMETAEGWTPEEGTPQGAVISPLLANLYLNPLDHRMRSLEYEMTRYADDFVVLCRTREEAEHALAEVQAWTAMVGLALHPDKTRIVDATLPGGFDFLGYHFERGLRWPRKKSTQKLKDTLRAKTRRTNGTGLLAIIETVNQTLSGWFAYFQHSHKTTFPRLDQWVRMRLRSILRKRSGRKGRGKGADHQRYPNSLFAERGLISLVAAHATAVQSVQR